MPRVKRNQWSGISMAARPPREETIQSLLSTHLALCSHRMEPSTLRRRERCILYWVYFLETRNIPILEATEAHALEMIAGWDAPDGWSKGSQRHFVVAVREFHDFLLDGGHADRNPWRRIHVHKPAKKLPRFLRKEEVDAMAAALNQPHWRDIRDRAILLFFYSTGCRIGELVGLDLKDLDLRHSTAIVMGKGHKEGCVYIAEPAVVAMRSYLRSVRPRLTPNEAGPVFVGRHGRRINVTVVRDGLLRAAQRANLGRHVHPHMMRHTAATHLRQAGADLRQVQEYLRHEDIGSTAIYTHVESEEVRRMHQEFHPLAKQAHLQKVHDAERDGHRHLRRKQA